MSPESGKRWHTREDSGLRLDRHGRWWHDGEPISHPKIVEAFNRGLVPTDDGRFILHFGRDWAYVQVDDAAYQVTAVDEVEGAIFLRLSDRTAERLDPNTLALDADGVFLCRVKEGRATARCSRDAQFALGNLLEPSGDQWVLRMGERTWTVPASP